MMATEGKDKGAASAEAVADQLARNGIFPQRNGAREAVALGVKLLAFKDDVPHGEWRNSLERMGLSTSFASRHMGMARYFADAPDAFFDAIGSASKMAVLLPLSLFSIDVLLCGENLHGLTLERIKPMTAKQLTAEIQKIIPLDKEHGLSLLKPQGKAFPELLSVEEEERMLISYRQCKPEARAALLQMAGLLADVPAP